ncbi:Protein of unknown function [Actinacidiphila yanglinensis]|uniref:DUF4232 domain-containing protein n=1 Tax=Actinacidiphila yanglinensis TaxID=310779 RepID=A0A1H6DB04_9ACTN|nr:Protein of unknown function [Actinacidiphila yanglinensis]
MAAVAAAVLALGTAGCGGGGASDTAAGSSSPPAATGSTSPPATGSSSAATPAHTTPAAPSGVRTEAAGDRCTVADLKMTLGRGDPGAGQVYYPLRFTNTSSHTCVLHGFPGVSLIQGDGSTTGTPAGREGARGGAVRLGPGRIAEADLHTLNQGVRGGSCWRTPTLLKAYPPGSKDAMTLAASRLVVCGGMFDVGAVH